jgi:phosphoribosylformimino-5-aminoimidazole carboxamide ribotide isomerase
MIIYPAIDIMNGKCVRLKQGDFSTQKVYADNPVNMALSFQQAGLKNLHLVDLDGAKEGSVKHWDVVKTITSQTQLRVDFGGGIKTENEIERLIESGIKQVNLGSIAYREPAKVKSWIKKFGSDKIILSADASNEILAVAGWQSQTKLSVFDFIQEFADSGLEFVTVTDISKDGMMAGPGSDLYKKILSKIQNIKLIASGGVRSWVDVEELENIGCSGCIIGKAIYEGSISLKEIPKQYL